MCSTVKSKPWATPERLYLSLPWQLWHSTFYLRSKRLSKPYMGLVKLRPVYRLYYLVEEVQGTFRGMMIALPPPLWQPWADLSVTNFADTLKQWEDKVDLKRFASSPRGPKKPKTKGEATLPEPNSHIDVRHPPSNGFALPYSLLAPAQTFPTHAHRHWETIRQFGKLRSCTL